MIKAELPRPSGSGERITNELQALAEAPQYALHSNIVLAKANTYFTNPRPEGSSNLNYYRT